MNLPVMSGEFIEVERAPEHDKPGLPALREVVSRRIFYFDGCAKACVYIPTSSAK